MITSMVRIVHWWMLQTISMLAEGDMVNEWTGLMLHVLYLCTAVTSWLFIGRSLHTLPGLYEYWNALLCKVNFYSMWLYRQPALHPLMEAAIALYRPHSNMFDPGVAVLCHFCKEIYFILVQRIVLYWSRLFDYLFYLFWSMELYSKLMCIGLNSNSQLMWNDDER